MQHIIKGDKVKVLAGKDNGREGTVDRVLVKDSKIFVAGINMYKRHINAKRFGQETGSVVELSKAINLSNVMLVCPNCKKPARVGIKFEGDTKVRFCKKCEKAIGVTK